MVNPLKSVLLVFLLIFSVNGSAEPQPYSEYVIHQALLNLPSYFQNLFDAYTMNEEDTARLRALEKVAIAYARDPQKYVLFRDGGDPIFDLKPGEPARMAVTDLPLDVPVYFNRGLLTENFTYTDAVTLWLHEFGHKIKTRFPKLTQDEIDMESKNLGRRYGSLGTFHTIDGQKVLIINPCGIEGSWMGGGSFTIAAVKGGTAADVSGRLHAALDKAQPSYLRYTESQRRVMDLYEAEPGVWGFALRTGRLVKRQDLTHFESDIGGGHFMRALIAWPSLEVKAYQPEDRPPPIIHDGIIHLVPESVQITQDTIAGRLEFELENQESFHAANFPWDTTEMIALVDGMPRRLEIRLRYGMDNRKEDITWWMPGEAYQKKQTYGAYFSIEAPQLAGHKVVLQSLISKFFRYGDYDPAQDQMFQIRLEPAVTVDWAGDLGCDEALTGGRYGFSIAKLIADGI